MPHQEPAEAAESVPPKTATDVGKDDATQVADKVFKDVRDSEFTGYVSKVTISIPE